MATGLFLFRRLRSGPDSWGRTGGFTAEVLFADQRPPVWVSITALASAEWSTLRLVLVGGVVRSIGSVRNAADLFKRCGSWFATRDEAVVRLLAASAAALHDIGDRGRTVLALLDGAESCYRQRFARDHVVPGAVSIAMRALAEMA